MRGKPNACGPPPARLPREYRIMGNSEILPIATALKEAV